MVYTLCLQYITVFKTMNIYGDIKGTDIYSFFIYSHLERSKYSSFDNDHKLVINQSMQYMHVRMNT